MTIQDQFLKQFNTNEKITTKDIYEWYTQVKGGQSSFTYYSSIFSVIINPLVRKGILKKVSKGVYEVSTLIPVPTTTNRNTISNELIDLLSDIEEEEVNEAKETEEFDEFDLYLQNRLKEVK